MRCKFHPIENRAISYKISHKNFRKPRSTAKIFFNDHQVTALKRSEMYTFAGFLSMCGGLLGLFLGVSALSVIELIYYVTLHLFWWIHQRIPAYISKSLHQMKLRIFAKTQCRSFIHRYYL